tara:strand:+ start:413 stop:628 length:216 start_codon:yes stop_codon:yes gene_type:complete
MDTQIRAQTLSLLLKTFGNTHTNKAIYECADEWCSKQVTTSGLVSYFKAYYGKYERQEGSQVDYKEGKGAP